MTLSRSQPCPQCVPSAGAELELVVGSAPWGVSRDPPEGWGGTGEGRGHGSDPPFPSQR